jgi:hypothetical protein
MILFEKLAGNRGRRQWTGIAVAALLLAACAPEDDSIGSHMAQPAAGMPKMETTDAGDIAIVGQEVAHGIMELPEVSGAAVPPLVQFNGVTSIVDKPIDTDPYTELLRDRLLLLTREKLRFVEHTLPPYVAPSKKKHKAQAQPDQNTTDPDYQILAELRGHADADFLKIQVEFVDSHTNQVLFNQVYKIRPEASGPQPDSGNTVSPSMDSGTPPPPPPPPSGNTTL